MVSCSINDDRRQLVHRHRIASEVPDVDIVQISWFNPQCPVHVDKSMYAGRAINFHIDVEHLALPALEF